MLLGARLGLLEGAERLVRLAPGGRAGPECLQAQPEFEWSEICSAVCCGRVPLCVVGDAVVGVVMGSGGVVALRTIPHFLALVQVTMVQQVRFSSLSRLLMVVRLVCVNYELLHPTAYPAAALSTFSQVI